METRIDHSSVARPYSPPSSAARAVSESAQEQAEQQTIKELSESRDFLEAVLETAVDAIVTIDRYGTIQSVNSSAVRMFGYETSELVGQNIGLLMPEPFRQAHNNYIARYLKTRQSRVMGVRRETVARRKDGSIFPVDLAISEIDHRGLFTGIVRDLSERKSLERQVLEIVNEEQRRIGQELHDCTGQELTGLTLIAGSMLDAMNRECESGKSVTPQQLEAWRATTAKLTDGLTIANQHVQQLSRGIIPVQIDREGLCTALRELCARTTELPNVLCRLSCKEETKTDSHHCATQLYRITQEAINNALRHGAASEIDVRVDCESDNAFLEVHDNGKGFVVEDSFRSGLPQDSFASPNKGHGLRIMRYRASMIGGSLEVQSEPGKGTLVRCTFHRHR